MEDIPPETSPGQAIQVGNDEIKLGMKKEKE